MSSSIWTQCAGASELRPLRLTAWRIVEAQHQISTRKLVSTLEEHALLEDLIERAKPPDPGRGRLHYLLATPFRYPPLRHGSRFGTRRERGIWYGSEMFETAAAELAYYRFVFLEGTRADLGSVTTDHTAFTAVLRSARGVDLAAAPFESCREAIASPTDYADTQALGAAMREAGVEVFRYPSARQAGGGNAGVFTPAVFNGVKPRALETWHCTATRTRVELFRRDYFTPAQLTFERERFLVQGRLPSPAL